MAGRFALLVGVSQYGAGFAPLPGSERDLEQMAQVLSNPTMGGFEVKRLLNPEPQMLRETIEEFFGNRSRDDVLLFYFSGHGALDDVSNQLYLSTSKTRKENQQLVKASAVEVTLLRDHLSSSNSTQKVVILDCCFSGAVANLLHKGDSDINLEPLRASGSVILASCESYELSYQSREANAENLAPSLYTRYLVEGIRTGAARKSSEDWIVTKDLHEYATYCFQLEQHASMQPRIIILDREGYKIPVSKAPRDIESEFSQAVAEQLKRSDGVITAGMNRFLEVKRGNLKIAPEVAAVIIETQRKPYVIRAAKRSEYAEAFREALEEGGISDFERETLRFLQVELSLQDGDVQAIEAEIQGTALEVSEPMPCPPVIDEPLSDRPPPSTAKEATAGGTVPEPVPLISRQVAVMDQPSPPAPPSPRPRDRWKIIVGVIIALVGIPTFLQLCQQPKQPDSDGIVSPVAIQPAEALISVGDNQKLYGSRSSKLSQEFRDRKADGIEAFREKNYGDALSLFKQLRADAKQIRADSNETQDRRSSASNTFKDPEILIFQNNAQARLNSQTSGKPVVTIAAAAPMSDTQGNLIDYGQQTLFGVAQAQAQAIEDGINLEVMIANDLNYPAQAKALAQDLVKPIVGGDGISRSILAVIGHYGSTVTCAALETYSKAELAVISPTSTHPDLRQDCAGKTFFRTTSSIPIEVKTLVDYLLNESQIPVPKVAIFYNSKEPSIDQTQTVSSYSKTMSKSLQETLKAQSIFAFEPIDLSASDFDAQKALDRVRDANVLALFPDGKVGGDEAVRRAVEVMKADGGQRLILGANTLAEQGSITQGNAKQVTAQVPGVGFLIAVDWFAGCGSNQAFIKDGEGIWGGSPTRIFALASEATQAVVFRLSQGKTTKQAILGDLSTGGSLPSNVFQNKTISFEPNGDRREIASRILVTPFIGQDNQKQFTLAPGKSCPNP
jgi:ABC-type branched-subunit amino acid transport system substrate-binding protein/uncharacterized metal-binding protein